MSAAISTSVLAANLDHFARTKHHMDYTAGRRRPWGQLLRLQSLSRPGSLSQCLARLRGNSSYFRVNMVMVVLLGVFLSLVYHPVSLMVFVAAMGAWVALFFLPDQPLVVLGRQLDDRLVLALLAALTLLLLVLTPAALNVVVSLAVSLLVVVVYSVLRSTDDLFLDEKAALAAGLLSGPSMPHS